MIQEHWLIHDKGLLTKSLLTVSLTRFSLTINDSASTTMTHFICEVVGTLKRHGYGRWSRSTLKRIIPQQLLHFWVRLVGNKSMTSTGWDMDEERKTVWGTRLSSPESKGKENPNRVENEHLVLTLTCFRTKDTLQTGRADYRRTTHQIERSLGASWILGKWPNKLEGHGKRARYHRISRPER
jgi:hypothetical protein